MTKEIVVHKFIIIYIERWENSEHQNDEGGPFSKLMCHSLDFWQHDQRDCSTQIYPNAHREMRNSDHQNDEDGRVFFKADMPQLQIFDSMTKEIVLKCTD